MKKNALRANKTSEEAGRFSFFPARNIALGFIIRMYRNRWPERLKFLTKRNQEAPECKSSFPVCDCGKSRS